jgi:hypothetical protein
MGAAPPAGVGVGSGADAAQDAAAISAANAMADRNAVFRIRIVFWLLFLDEKIFFVPGERFRV